LRNIHVENDEKQRRNRENANEHLVGDGGGIVKRRNRNKAK